MHIIDLFGPLDTLETVNAKLKFLGRPPITAADVIEDALAKDGMSRAERRRTMAHLRGTSKPVESQSREA